MKQRWWGNTHGLLKIMYGERPYVGDRAAVVKGKTFGMDKVVALSIASGPSSA